MSIIKKLGFDIPAIKAAIEKDRQRTLEYVDEMDLLIGNKLIPLNQYTLEELDELIDGLPNDGFFRSELRSWRGKHFGNVKTEREQQLVKQSSSQS